jgi:hypothetical protein
MQSGIYNPIKAMTELRFERFSCQWPAFAVKIDKKDASIESLLTLIKTY